MECGRQERGSQRSKAGISLYSGPPFVSTLLTAFVTASCTWHQNDCGRCENKMNKGDGWIER